jgi:hypothetical protein
LHRRSEEKIQPVPIWEWLAWTQSLDEHADVLRHLGRLAEATAALERAEGIRNTLRIPRTRADSK